MSSVITCHTLFSRSGNKNYLVAGPIWSTLDGPPGHYVLGDKRPCKNRLRGAILHISSNNTGIIVKVKLILKLHNKENKMINQTNNKVNGIRHENDRQSDCLNNKVIVMAECRDKNMFYLQVACQKSLNHLSTPLCPE
jgi:hypothetical protein